jgi:hypothetical protein
MKNHTGEGTLLAYGTAGNLDAIMRLVGDLSGLSRYPVTVIIGEVTEFCETAR